MDCLEAQAFISAAHDGEHVNPRVMAEATAHCDECPECGAFREGLRVIDEMHVPEAPPETIDAVLAAVASAAAERAAAERIEVMQREVDLLAAADALPDTGDDDAPGPDSDEKTAKFGGLPLAPMLSRLPRPTAARPAWLEGVLQRFGGMNDSVKWAGVGALTALAATALVAFIVVGGSGKPASTAGVRTTAGADSSTGEVAAGGNWGYGSKSPSGGAASTPTNPAPTSAPDYIAYESKVYTPGALLNDSSTATPTIGSAKTAFATGGGIQDVTVFASPLKDGSIVVSGPDGYRLYEPVVRRLSSKRYQLVAGNPLERFGIWPMLPTRFTPPQSADGSPSFTAAGTDSAGVAIYAASGQPVSTGFAVAPGTATTDPASGNPNWTWWEPLDQ